MNQLDLIAKKLLEKREEKGKTPILSKNSWTINGNNTISDIINLLKDDIRTEEDIYLYINSSLEPNKDENISDLYMIFNKEGKLCISYSTKPSFL
ncbi:Ubiquitin-like autophagy protein Apg12 [Cryptosporidium hominis]|uniref:Ubiquitin-like protein ATG12 n=1 Tax=Cryptosporidium hominis TaxID=237895 RepID=A0ABX5BAJ8_CRYHO|nr:Ubiquitin-like autophagy protein Apg12 [Cryptosporidium hominis]|eukprot:PPS93955.1 Ubiquitin-like autophagy protein Apg12 [Cryptosporidium hominis]